MRNCPNCAAPIEPYKCKCEHCGTWYFDFASFDLTDGKPCYVKFRTPMGVITTLARPELNSVTSEIQYADVCNYRGNRVSRFQTGRTCDIDITFHALLDMSNEGSLFSLEAENRKEE